MRKTKRIRRYQAIATLFAATTLGCCVWEARGDDQQGSSGSGPAPGPIARLFRVGRASSARKPSAASTSDVGSPSSAPNNADSLFGSFGSTSTYANTPGSRSTASSQPMSPGSGPRIRPQPKSSRPITDADPLLTLTSILKSDNGQRFAMFMQVYADGTIVDGEGVHHVARTALQPLVDALRGSEAMKQHGHCGGPPTDYLEQTHVIVYERGMGRLRANAFSYSGNTEGCDHSLKHVRDAIDALQRQISGQGSAASAHPAAPSTDPSLPGLAPLSPAAPSPMPPVPLDGARSIPLDPLD